VLDGSPFRMELARGLVALGSALRRAGQNTGARDPLRRAADLAQRCGANGLAERATDELRATGARPRRVELTGVAALTAREHQIATLAASGLTNRQIAQQQFVTERTVESHLLSAFGKLGISRRSELRDVLPDPDRS
jgi:DNA-binding CsgD family transcriptional regulator